MHRARGLAPPRGSAAVGQARAIGLRRDVQARRAPRPPARSARRVGASTGAPSTRATRPGGLAVEQREQRAGAVGNRRGHFDAGAREMRHQVEVERQLRRRQPLVERQHVTAALGRDEVVGVLDARGDRRELGQPAHRIAREPCVEFGSGDRRVDGHARTQAGISGGRATATLAGCERGQFTRKTGATSAVCNPKSSES